MSSNPANTEETHHEHVFEFKEFALKGAVLACGSFITVAINFASLAFIIFMMVKQVNRMKKAEAAPAPAAPAPTPEDVLLLRQIRDSLAR